MSAASRVAPVTLSRGRNQVGSAQVGGGLRASGFELVARPPAGSVRDLRRGPSPR